MDIEKTQWHQKILEVLRQKLGREEFISNLKVPAIIVAIIVAGAFYYQHMQAQQRVTNNVNVGGVFEAQIPCGANGIATPAMNSEGYTRGGFSCTYDVGDSQIGVTTSSYIADPGNNETLSSIFQNDCGGDNNTDQQQSTVNGYRVVSCTVVKQYSVGSSNAPDVQAYVMAPDGSKLANIDVGLQAGTPNDTVYISKVLHDVLSSLRFQ